MQFSLQTKLPFELSDSEETFVGVALADLPLHGVRPLDLFACAESERLLTGLRLSSLLWPDLDLSEAAGLTGPTDDSAVEASGDAGLVGGGLGEGDLGGDSPPPRNLNTSAGCRQGTGFEFFQENRLDFVEKGLTLSLFFLLRQQKFMLADSTFKCFLLKTFLWFPQKSCWCSELKEL